MITVTKGSLVINHYGNINKSVRDHQTMSNIQSDRNDLQMYLPFHLKYLLPSLLLLLLLRNYPLNLEQRIQRFKLYLMKSLMMIQRDTYHQAIHQGFCIVPPTTTSPAPNRDATLPAKAGIPAFFLISPDISCFFKISVRLLKT